MVAVRRVRMVRMWIVAVRIVAVRRVAVHGIVWMVAVRCVRMVRMWIVAVHGIVRVRRVAVHGIVRMVAVRRVAVRRVAVHGRMRMVVVPGAAVEFAAARCAHAVRGAGRFGVGGSGLGGLHRYSHRAAQLEEEQNKSEHRAARCVCGRHSYLREVLLGRKRGSRC
jgi:hypothetical protein